MFIIYFDFCKVASFKSSRLNLQNKNFFLILKFQFPKFWAFVFIILVWARIFLGLRLITFFFRIVGLTLRIWRFCVYVKFELLFAWFFALKLFYHFTSCWTFFIFGRPFLSVFVITREPLGTGRRRSRIGFKVKF